MGKLLQAAVLLLSMASLLPAADSADALQSGRRMLPCTVEGKTLNGAAPHGKGAPFYITDGSNILWQGHAGEQFSLTPKQKLEKLYLVATSDNNIRWQNLTWEGDIHAPEKGKALELNAADFGMRPGTEDAGPAMRKILDAARKNTGKGRCTIHIPKGIYHFYPNGALQLSYYISNHDQQNMHPVGVPLVNLQNVRIEAHGSTFIFHGRMQPILFMDCRKITLCGLNIAYATPFYVEGAITDISEPHTTLRMSNATPNWRIDNGQFRFYGDDWEQSIQAALAFEPDGPMVPTGRGGDIGWPGQAEQLDAHHVRFPVNAGTKGLAKGQILVLRSYWRPHPAMVLYRAKDTHLHDVVFHDSQGMALLAQRSENITIKGGGCIRAKGRLHTAAADATHFSNCRGYIHVSNALYEGMMDDAINVHSTCLGITAVHSPTKITARYMHSQAVGFEVFLPGERIQFIRGKTLENHPRQIKVAQAQKQDERHLLLTLAEPLPEDIGTGDAIENADWYPGVIFRNNEVRHNRARGTLFTTPKKVLVENNRFIRSHGSAILLAGDAQGWYESGRCRDVIIRKNIFEHNLTAAYQFTNAIISICPEVKQPDRQTTRYHENIRIEDNTFITHRVPLLSAISAHNLIFKNNRIQYNEIFPSMYGGAPFNISHSGNTELQPVNLP